MQLPPKRYQLDADPKYDAIRHLPWFWTLRERREKIAVLEVASDLIKDGSKQWEAAEIMGVDERDIRDFMDFKAGRSRLMELQPSDRRQYQALLDQAYDVFRDTAGRKAFTQVIYDEGKLFGLNARHVVELWEVDPIFYPSHYNGLK